MINGDSVYLIFSLFSGLSINANEIDGRQSKLPGYETYRKWFGQEFSFNFSLQRERFFPNIPDIMAHKTP